MASSLVSCLKNASGSLIHKSSRVLFASASAKLQRTPQRAFSDEAPPAEEEPVVAEVVAESAPDDDGSTYKVPEYYGYDEYSFYEIENDILKDRLPQPDGSMKLF